MLQWLIKLYPFNTPQEKIVIDYLDNIAKEHNENIFIYKDTRTTYIETQYFCCLDIYRKTKFLTDYNIKCIKCLAIIKDNEIIEHSKICLVYNQQFIYDILQHINNYKLCTKSYKN
jgi:hypothetical protein